MILNLYSRLSSRTSIILIKVCACSLTVRVGSRGRKTTTFWAVVKVTTLFIIASWSSCFSTALESKLKLLHPFHFSTRHASVNTTFLVSTCGLLVTMDSQGASRRSSACSSVFSQEELESYGLDEEQMRNLKRTFDQFDSDKSGALSVDTVHMILKMMGIHVSTMAVQVNNIVMFLYFSMIM